MMAAATTSHTAGLEEELSKHISSLEDALAVITATKRQLANNAAQAKSGIHTMMSRQLEALRTREVWLLSQVELLHDTKDTVLREQAESLRQALGALQSCRQYIEDTGEAGDLEMSIQETIDRLSKLELHPLQNRQLSFKADLAKMRDAIHSFGHVDDCSHMTTARSAAAAAGIDPLGYHGDSQSLPRAFEEYEDEDTQHLMYKTVQDVTTKGTCTHRMVKVAVPKLKAKPSEWLFLPTDVKPPVQTAAASATLPLFKSDMSEWLLQRGKQDGSVASVQQWLHEIQSHADLEEEEDIIPTTGCKSTSSFDVLSLPSDSCGTSTVTTAKPAHNSTAAYFQQVNAAPNDKWLKHISSTTTTPTSSSEFEAMKYFTQAAASGNWLMKQESQEESQEKSPCCCKGGITTVCPPVSPDIEDLDLMSCTQPATKPEDKEEEEKDVDEREQALLRNIDQLCRANETCHTFTDCVCDENCQQSPTSDNKAWLSRPSSKEDINAPPQPPVFDYFSMVAGSKAEDWLKLPTSAYSENESDDEDILYPPFHDKNTSPSKWLLDSQMTSPPPSGSMDTTCPFTRSSHHSQWLLTHPAFRPSTSTTTSTSTHAAAACSSQWLSSPSKPVTKQNPWLSTSSPPTLQQQPNTEQLNTYLDQVKPQYQWCLTHKPHDDDDKAMEKKEELPECDNRDALSTTSTTVESAKWLLISKDDQQPAELEAKEIYMETDLPSSVLSPNLVKNKSALGEWLLNIHSDF